MKAVILARVSTKDQEGGHSLPAQTMLLKTYCELKKLDIIKEFQITESSTRGERKEFKEVLKYIDSQKEPTALVCHKVDRLQRSFNEYHLLNKPLQEGKLELHFTQDNSILNKNSTSSQKLMWNMQIVMSQNYTDSISDNVKRSIQKKKEEGTILFQAPLGYVNLKDGKGGVAIDETRHLFIKQIFEMYSTGLYGFKELAKTFNDKGLRTKRGNELDAKAIQRILSNSFYCGFMVVDGKKHNHIYPCLISTKMFDKCANAMVDRGRTKKNYSKTTKEFYIFKKLVRCKKCGCLISCEKKKGKYIYLRPNSKEECDCKHISEKKALEVINGVLNRLYLDEEKILTYKNSMKEFFAESSKASNEMLTSYRKQYDTLEVQKKRLLNLYLSESITQNEYDKEKLGLNDMQHKIGSQMQDLSDNDESVIIGIEYMLDIVSNCKYVFKSSGNEKKRILVNLLFSNLWINGSNLEFSLRKPFDQLLKLDKKENWRPQRDSNPCCGLERAES